MNRVVLLLLALATVPAVHVLQGEDIGGLWGAAPALLSILLPISVAGVCHRRDLVRALQASCNTDALPPGTALRWIEVLQGLRRSCFAGGALATVLGLIVVLAHFGDPSKIGPGVAVAWIACLYTVYASELCLAPLIRQLAIRGQGFQAWGEQAASEGSLGEPPEVRRGSTYFAVIGLTGLFLAGAQAVEGEHPGDLLQAAAALMVCASLLFAAGWHGPGALKDTLWVGAGSSDSTRKELEQRHHIVRSLRSLIYAMASLGFLVGSIAVMSHLDDPERVGQGVATAVVSWVYALILAELILGPVQRRLRTARAQRGVEDTPLARAAHTGPEAVWLLVGAVVFITPLVLLAVNNAGSSAG